MNTITNFHNQNNVYTKNNQQPNQNIQFKGLNLKTLTKSSKIIQERIMDRHYQVAGILGQEPKEIINMTKGASPKRLFFLDALANSYNAKNFGLKNEQVENSKYVNNIFNMIKNPTPKHAAIVHGHNGSMEQLERIFTQTENNNQKLEFVRDMQKEIIPSKGIIKERTELISELLESPNSETYIKDFPKYKSYLLLNKNDEKAVKNLDKMVETKTFSQRKYDIELDNKAIFNKSTMIETKVFNGKVVEENYKPERQEFLNAFVEKHGVSTENLQSGNDKDILDMYKSTNKNNLNIRSRILDELFFRPIDNYKAQGKNESVTELKQLFDTIDNDKHAKSFVIKTLNDEQNKINTPKEFNKLFVEHDTKKLDIFYDNAMNIISQTKGKERTEALKKEIKNPFFETKNTKECRQDAIKYGYIKKESIFSKAGKLIKNGMNILKEKMTKDTPVVNKETKVAKEVETVISKPMPTITSTKMAEENAERIKTKETVAPNKTQELQTALLDAAKSEMQNQPVAEIAAKPEIPQAKEIVNEARPVINLHNALVDSAKNVNVERPSLLPTPTAKTPVTITRTVPKAPNAKKLAVINDVNSIIEKKLGAKTLENQKQDYAIKATKMRMNMLPEIFASIKETRATDKAVGKIKSNSSNKDALALYEKINGKNKKLVNYMLKKRNVDGTRMFEVKDIITTLDKAEKKVATEKKTAPKTYKSADAKMYYNSLVENNIQQYGKLDRTKNK